MKAKDFTQGGTNTRMITQGQKGSSCVGCKGATGRNMRQPKFAGQTLNTHTTFKFPR